MSNPLESQAASTGWRSDYQMGLDDGRKEQQARISELEAQLAAAQKDAELAARAQALRECVAEIRGMKANHKVAQSAINQCAEALEALK